MSYRRLSKKPLLFRSFTGLTVLEFDDVYKEIESKYEEYERTRRQDKRSIELEMVIPDFEMMMKPMLNYASDKQEHFYRDTIEFLANEYNLRDNERKELLPSGRMPIFDNRVGWTQFHLKKAGLLEATRRGFYEITQEGLIWLLKNP